MPHKILYIPRIGFSRKPTPLKKAKQFFKPKKFAGQEGFFSAALHLAFNVREKNMTFLQKNAQKVSARYDGVVIDWQVKEDGKLGERKDFEAVKQLSIPAVLFCGNARAGLLPSDEVMDLFDVIFKREPFKDLDRYPIADRNKHKIHATMLACKAIPLNHRNLDNVHPGQYGRSCYQTDWKSDVFFLGQATHQERIDTIRALSAMDISFSGGLFPLSKRSQMRQNRLIPLDTYRDVHQPKIQSTEYFERMQQSRINLCPAGFGEFTFRHQEAWLYNCFTLCESNIADLNLLINAIPYQHYVPYDSLQDLKEKILYFLDRDEERKVIADNARKQFVSDYSPQRHGRFIQQAIFG